jgi:hypothetical protein
VAFFALANMTWGQARFYGKAALTGGCFGLVLALFGTMVWTFVADTHSVSAAIATAFSKASQFHPWVIGPFVLFALLNMWLAWRAHLRALAGGPPSFFPFLAQTVRTGIFGSQLVAQSLLRDVVQVPLVTRLTVLGFDRPWQDIRNDYKSGWQCAMRKLQVTLRKRPAFLAERLRETVELAQARLTQMRGQPVQSLRACVIEPFGGQSLRVIHGHNMVDDADDRLTLDVNGAGAGKAFRTGDAVTITFGPGSAPPFMTKYERALLRRTLRVALCIPIFDRIDAWEQDPSGRPNPLGVLAIDSDEDLSGEFTNPVFIAAMAEQTVLISRAFGME